MIRRELLLGSGAWLVVSQANALEAPTKVRGLWRDDSGYVAIGAFPEFGQAPFVFDYASLLVGPLAHVGGPTWDVSGALNSRAPSAASLTLDQGVLRMGARTLAPVALVRTSFAVPSLRKMIHAEVAKVSARPCRGTVLMIYGSGPAPKEALDLWSFWFLAAGFAVVTYDKRGSGQSTGDWRLSSLIDLAQDASAVLGGVRSMGLQGPVFAWGASQAGWIEPQLGAAGLLDGIIMHAGAATTPGAQIIDQIKYELKAYGFSPEEISRAAAYYGLDRDVSCGIRPWSDIDSAYKSASASGAEWILGPPPAADAAERTMIKLMAGFDPTPYWRDNTAPTLALYGDRDWVVPVETNLPRLREIVSSSTALSAIVLPGANHIMFQAKSGTRDEYPKLSRIVPGYFEAIRTWLGQRS